MSSRGRTLAAASCASLALQWLCAAALGGRLHPDEIHQYLEPAHRMVWGYGARSHEWFRGMRNVVGPSLVAAPMWACRALGVDDPRAHLALVHAMLAALSLVAVACAYDIARASRDDRAARVAALTLALWIPWDNLAFRTLGETLSTLTTLLALRAVTARSAYVTAGLWLGAGFALRYPAGLFVAGVCAHLAATRAWRPLARVLAGFAVPVLALGALDAHTWGAPWHSLRAYADFNLVQGRAALEYGTRPAWFYLACAMAFAPWPLLLGVAPPRLRDGGVVVTVAAVYLAAMSALAHKEPRFFLTVVPLLVIALAVAWAPATTRRAQVAVALAALQSAAVFAAWRATDVLQRDLHAAALSVGRREDLGALVVVDGYHPGMSRIHRDVPVVFDPRGRPAVALASLDALPAVPVVYALCDASRTPRCDAELTARGFARDGREGRITVWRRSLTARHPR